MENKFDSGPNNPRGRPRQGRMISSYIRDILEEQGLSGQPKRKEIAIRLVDMALDPETPRKDFLLICTEIMDRLEGKATNINLNADVTYNPLEGIETAKIEALKKKLEEAKPDEAA